MTDLGLQTAVELTAALRERRIGALELLDHFLDRVERFNPAINAIVVLDAERARERAREADAALAAGQTWGPLHGLPVTIKDAFDVTGLPTTWGSPGLKNNVATSNAVMVERMLAAGAVLFGKTNVPLMLRDSQTYNEVYGTTRNPWDTERSPGGSSGGSAAAIAAGLTGLDGASDMAGSIRNPSVFCGVYGHKPTYGVIPSRGHALPGQLAPGDINVVGPIARAAEDLDLALDVVAGPDVLTAPGWRLDLPGPGKNALKDFRVAVWADDPVCPVDSEVTDRLQAVTDALAQAGAVVDDQARPAIDSARSHTLFLQMMRAFTAGALPLEDFDAMRDEAASLSPDDEGFDAQVATTTAQHHRDWLISGEERERMRFAWADFFTDFDVVLAPVMPSAPFLLDESEPRTARTVTINGKPFAYMEQLFWAGLFGLVYLPGTAVPIGCNPDGLPIGMQIVGPAFGDRTTIAFARLLAVEFGGFSPPPGYD